MKFMKNITNTLALVSLVLIILCGACSSDASEEMPSAVSQFTTQYFPGYGVKSYNELSDGGCVVKLSNGPTLRFNSDGKWIDINGNGAKLPQVLMYDQLPADLYDYLQVTEQQSDIYVVKRDRHFYKLTMLDTVLTYDISTGKVIYPDGSTPK